MGFLRCLIRGLGLTTLLLFLVANLALDTACSSSVEDFDPYSFINNNTTFYSDFKKLRAKWFTVEEQVFGIEDPYDPVDWSKIRDSAKWVVSEHERMTVKFAKDSTSALSHLKRSEVEQAQAVSKRVLEYIDSAGMVIMKLYQITEKLYGKTKDPYSYNMTAYHLDVEQFKNLYEVFQAKGTELNKLLYGR